MFVLADPDHGAQKHHKENAVMVPSYSEALELVRRGYSIRMSDGRNAPSLVTPASLEFIDEPVDRLDDLWNYTMPEVPFSLDTVMQELRWHLLSQASDLAVIADPDTASAWLGFEFDGRSSCECQEVAELIDLERFNITRIVKAAYQSAFRPWPGDEISEDDVDELEQIVAGSIVRFGRRHASPIDREGSALQRTLLAAYCRWQILDGCFLERETLDQGATEAIGALTGMPANAVRNALSRDGISLVKSKLDYPALINWIITRRNFAPLRQSETHAERWAWRVRHELLNQTLPEAFAKIRSMISPHSADLSEAERAIAERRDANQMPSENEIRRYAKALGVAPDSLILELHKAWASR